MLQVILFCFSCSNQFFRCAVCSIETAVHHLLLSSKELCACTAALFRAINNNNQQPFGFQLLALFTRSLGALLFSVSPKTTPGPANTR
jgi:hypothetical protein